MAIITIARGSLNWGIHLAQMLADSLDHECISRDMLLEDAASKFKLDRNELGKTLEKPPSFWERITGGRKKYLAILQSSLFDHACSGNMIYHGHAGHFLLDQIPFLFKIRLIAPIPMRVQAAMESKQMNKIDAEQHIHEVDDIRTRWTKYLYDADWRDPINYDLVVNLDSMKIETAKKMICQAVEEDEFAVKQGDLIYIKNLCLASRVKAYLAIDRETESLEFDVSADDGVITLSGNIEIETLRPLIVEIVKRTEGVRAVHDELTARRSSPIPT